MAHSIQGGIVGMILTIVFAKNVGLIFGETKTFFFHLQSLVIVTAFCFVGSYAIYFISNYARNMRVSDEEEFKGLDLSQHGEKNIKKWCKNYTTSPFYPMKIQYQLTILPVQLVTTFNFALE